MMPMPRRAASSRKPRAPLLQKRVATGEQDSVERHDGSDISANLPLVHAKPEATDNALRLKVGQGRKRPSQGLAQPGGLVRAMRVSVDVVHQQKVDPVKPQTRKACIHRPQCAVAGVVIDRLSTQDQPSHLG